MNRKLHNSFLAFSATGLVMLAGLIAVVPGTPAAQSGPVASAAQADAPAMRTAASQPAHAVAIQARVGAFEARIQHSTSAGELLAETAAFTAAIATEAALIAAFEPAADEVAAQARADRHHRRQVRSSRAALALPYFSFAQGLRHNRS